MKKKELTEKETLEAGIESLTKTLVMLDHFVKETNVKDFAYYFVILSHVLQSKNPDMKSAEFMAQIEMVTSDINKVDLPKIFMEGMYLTISSQTEELIDQMKESIDGNLHGVGDRK